MKHSNEINVPLRKTKITFFAFFIAIAILILASCSKEKSAASDTPAANAKALTAKEPAGFGNYRDLAPETIGELQQAKIATARYNNFENAIADGFVDINVIVPEMGYHYLKTSRLDATFEYDKPEILVYNREDNGRMKLVAVEYAVPIADSPNPPAGFTGNSDHWGVYQGVLWTLHAWIWEYNPSGVFNPTNPLIHLH